MTREPYWPAHVTLTREPHTDDQVTFIPPAPRGSRLERVGSSACTLVRESCDDLDRSAPNPHFGTAEAAARITQAAADSILRPAHLANRNTNHD